MLSKLKNKWIGLSPVAKTSLALVIAKFFQKGLAFITNPIFTRIMPSSEYGIISTFTSWQSALYIIATLNMASGVFNNGMVDFKDDRESFISSILALANTFTLGFLFIYLLFRTQLNQLFDMPETMTWIMIVYFFFTPAYNYWMGKQRFEFKYKSVLVLSLISSLIPSILAIIFVILAPDSGKAIAKVSATEISAIAIGIIFYIYTFRKSPRKINFKYWKYALAINLPLVPHYLSLYVLSSSDRIMITKLVNTSATAIYSLSYTVAASVLILWNAIDAAYAPWIYQKMDEKEYKRINKRGEEVVLIFALFTVIVALFAPEIIRILGPEEYHEGVYLIPVVVAGVFFTAVFSLYMRVELYLKKTKTIMLATTLAALMNIVLNYIFINLYGYMAAAYTTLACYVLLAIFHAINLNRLGYGNVYNNARIFAISTMVCLIIIGLSFVYQYTIVRYLLILSVSVILIIYRKKVRGVFKKK